MDNLQTEEGEDPFWQHNRQITRVQTDHDRDDQCDLQPMRMSARRIDLMAQRRKPGEVTLRVLFFIYSYSLHRRQRPSVQGRILSGTRQSESQLQSPLTYDHHQYDRFVQSIFTSMRIDAF